MRAFVCELDFPFLVFGQFPISPLVSLQASHRYFYWNLVQMIVSRPAAYTKQQLIMLEYAPARCDPYYWCCWFQCMKLEKYQIITTSYPVVWADFIHIYTLRKASGWNTKHSLLWQCASFFCFDWYIFLRSGIRVLSLECTLVVFSI